MKRAGFVVANERRDEEKGSEDRRDIPRWLVRMHCGFDCWGWLWYEANALRRNWPGCGHAFVREHRLTERVATEVTLFMTLR